MRVRLTSWLTSVRALDDVDQLSEEEIQLVQPFNPTFTYPIYGEKEVIFGYKDLKINVGPSLSNGLLYFWLWLTLSYRSLPVA